eukprot:gene18440-8022_t
MYGNTAPPCAAAWGTPMPTPATPWVLPPTATPVPPYSQHAQPMQAGAPFPPHAPAATPPASGKKLRPGDWLYPKKRCGVHNYSRRMACYRCNLPRPAAAGPPQPGQAPGARAPPPPQQQQKKKKKKKKGILGAPPAAKAVPAVNKWQQVPPTKHGPPERRPDPSRHPTRKYSKQHFLTHHGEQGKKKWKKAGKALKAASQPQPAPQPPHPSKPPLPELFMKDADGTYVPVALQDSTGKPVKLAGSEQPAAGGKKKKKPMNPQHPSKLDQAREAAAAAERECNRLRRQRAAKDRRVEKLDAHLVKTREELTTVVDQHEQAKLDLLEKQAAAAAAELEAESETGAMQEDAAPSAAPTTHPTLAQPTLHGQTAAECVVSALCNTLAAHGCPKSVHGAWAQLDNIAGRLERKEKELWWESQFRSSSPSGDFEAASCIAGWLKYNAPFLQITHSQTGVPQHYLRLGNIVHRAPTLSPKTTTAGHCVSQRPVQGGYEEADSLGPRRRPIEAQGPQCTPASCWCYASCYEAPHDAKLIISAIAPDMINHIPDCHVRLMLHNVNPMYDSVRLAQGPVEELRDVLRPHPAKLLPAFYTAPPPAAAPAPLAGAVQRYDEERRLRIAAGKREAEANARAAAAETQAGIAALQALAADQRAGAAQQEAYRIVLAALQARTAPPDKTDIPQRPDLEAMGMPDLRKLAEKFGAGGNRKETKEELVDALTSLRAQKRKSPDSDTPTGNEKGATGNTPPPRRPRTPIGPPERTPPVARQRQGVRSFFPPSLLPLLLVVLVAPLLLAAARSWTQRDCAQRPRPYLPPYFILALVARIAALMTAAPPRRPPPEPPPRRWGHRRMRWGRRGIC